VFLALLYGYRGDDDDDDDDGKSDGKMMPINM
jgi:hypothetical protein